MLMLWHTKLVLFALAKKYTLNSRKFSQFYFNQLFIANTTNVSRELSFCICSSHEDMQKKAPKLGYFSKTAEIFNTVLTA